MKYDVFISYSSLDQKVVEGLCAYLESHKIRCFVAYRDIPRGVVWAKAIVNGLDESRMMVVVFSDHFNNSDQVDREIELASEEKKPILTFRITDDAFKGVKKYYLKNLNWIDAFPDPQAVFGSVAENVAKLLDMDIKSITPAPQPAPKPVPPAKTYKVGDLYDENGKRGVVFEVSADGKHGKIVSLIDSGEPLQWASNGNDRWKKRVRAYSETDGAVNMSVVKSIPQWRKKYPAFAWCADLGEDWYLPANDELKSICDNKDIINTQLKIVDKISDDTYWSSTVAYQEIRLDGIKNQFGAYNIIMCDDDRLIIHKGDSGILPATYKFNVRAVSAF